MSKEQIQADISNALSVMAKSSNERLVAMLELYCIDLFNQLSKADRA